MAKKKESCPDSCRDKLESRGGSSLLTPTLWALPSLPFWSASLASFFLSCDPQELSATPVTLKEAVVTLWGSYSRGPCYLLVLGTDQPLSCTQEGKGPQSCYSPSTT